MNTTIKREAGPLATLLSPGASRITFIGALVLALLSFLSITVELRGIKLYSIGASFSKVSDVLKDDNSMFLILLLGLFVISFASVVISLVAYKFKNREMLARIGFGVLTFVYFAFVVYIFVVHGRFPGLTEKKPLFGMIILPFIAAILSLVFFAYSRDSKKSAPREQRAAYTFLIPAFLGLSLITYLPLIASFGIGFTNLEPGHFLANSNLEPVGYVGFQNFIEIFTKPSYNVLNSIWVTVYYALLAVVGSIVYSMLIALLLNRKMPARGFFRSVFYLPYILPAASVFITWNFLLQPNGLINSVLSSLGLGKSLFLSDTKLVVPMLALIAMWQAGNLIVILLAGLQNVPRVYHEAAEIDGANFWHRFWKITIPCMTPIIFFNLLMALVTSLQVVVPALVSTKGGPGNATSFLTYLIWSIGIDQGHYGTAGAISVVFFVVAAILAFILFATSKKWIFYEGEEK